MSSDARRWQFSKVRNSSSQLTEESEGNSRVGSNKGMPKQVEHSGTASPSIPAKTSSKELAVQRNDSREIVGLFLDVFVAGAAAIRSKPGDIQAELSPKLVRALLYLVRHGGSETTVGSLADGLGVSLGWASRVADELVAIGFLTRIRDSRDRRIVRLELSERAKEAGNKLWAARERAVTAALSEVSPSEGQAIVRFLRRFVAELGSPGSKTRLRHD